jgi:hypothetical protein
MEAVGRRGVHSKNLYFQVMAFVVGAGRPRAQRFKYAVLFCKRYVDWPCISY